MLQQYLPLVSRADHVGFLVITEQPRELLQLSQPPSVQAEPPRFHLELYQLERAHIDVSRETLM